MAERQWVKQWYSWWTSRSHRKLGPDPLFIGLALMSLVRWEKGKDEAWAVFEDGSPMPVSAIAELAQMPVGRADAALWKLAARGTVACRDDGAWGLPKTGKWQESADAARKRKPAGTSAETPPVAEGDADAASLREGSSVGSEPKHSVETASEALTLSGTVEAKPPRKRGPRLARVEYPPELAEHLLAEINAAAKTLGKRGHRKIGGTMSDHFAKLYGDCEPTREDISHVVAVRAEKDRRREGYGSLTWDSICVPGNFRRWLNEPLGKPAANGRAEPSPRPTQGGTVDLKALVGGKSNPCS